MSVRVKCPECRAINRIDEDEVGQRIRCKECDERFRVLKEDLVHDDDDDLDVDRPRRRKKKKSGGGYTLLIVLLGGGAVLLTTMCVGGIGLVWLISREQDPDPIPQGRGKVVLDQRGQLVASDPRDPLHPASHMKVHPVQMQKGKMYHIFLNSNSFDAFLRLESPKGQNLAEDDDSGQGPLDSMIIHRATETGMHRVIATSLGSGTGKYHVNVQEAD